MTERAKIRVRVVGPTHLLDTIVLRLRPLQVKYGEWRGERREFEVSLGEAPGLVFVLIPILLKS